MSKQSRVQGCFSWRPSAMWLRGATHVRRVLCFEELPRASTAASSVCSIHHWRAAASGVKHSHVHQILHAFFIGIAGGIEVVLKYPLEVEISCSWLQHLHEPWGPWCWVVGSLSFLATKWLWSGAAVCWACKSSVNIFCSVLTNVHFFFSFPAPATAGGYTAVGLSAATLTDAAVAAAASPDFATSRAANDPAWPAYSAFAAPCTR